MQKHGNERKQSVFREPQMYDVGRRSLRDEELI